MLSVHSLFRILLSAVLLAATLHLSLGCSGQPANDATIAARVDTLQSYLVENYQTPEDYVVAKFTDHNIVFLGERHRLKHDVALVQDLIPLLHDAGVYHLGIEFARWADQLLIDSLVSGEQYHEQLVRQIQFNQWPWWGFQDYLDIFKAAWEFNRSRPEGAPLFRVIGLMPRTDFSHLRRPEDREDKALMAKVWPDGDGDQYMAEVIIREILEPGHKALIYSGCNHAYTRYHQPVYDFDNDTLIRLVTGRMGNRVYDHYGDRCFNIFLHSPWPSSEGHSRSVPPADGLIDSLIAHLPDSLQRAGFDVARTPFADLPGESGFWKYGYPDFSLADYCDGYIIQGPMTGYRGVSVAEGFINEQNRIAAILQSANPEPRVKDTTRSVADLVESLASDTKIQAIFARDVIGYDRLKR